MGCLKMEELRKMCEITTSSPSDTNWLLKFFENQDVLVLRWDAGCGREQLIIYENTNEESRIR